MACSYYSIQNTGLTNLTVSFTSCESGCVFTGFIIPPGETYYVDSDGDPVIISGTGTYTQESFDVTQKFNFSGSCGDNFYIYSKLGAEPLFEAGHIYCMSAVTQCSTLDVLPTQCFEFMGVGEFGYPQYSTISTPVYSGTELAICELTCPCAVSPTPTQTPTPTPTPSPSSPPLPCTVVNYCLQGTGYDFDGVYSVSGDTYNGYNFYYNEDLTYFIYFSLLENQWCLSSSPGGTCLLSGKSPCTSICPDLCDEYFSSEICPTPTPTPTINCDVFNFEAIFDCMVTPTASVTPTVSSTPTPTPTPSETPLCPFINVDATIEGLTPTPSPTSTPTPTPSGVVDRPCSLSGDVTFNTINADIKCPVSFEFQDCYNGMLYYTTSDVVIPSGGTLVKYMVFESVVDGQDKCITYLGSTTSVSGINVIELIKGPVGYANSGGCGKCFIPENSPTPTPTPTPTPVFCFCYSAFNNSKLGGSVEWVDCSGNTQTVSVPLGVIYSFCSSISPIVYGDIIIGTNGICGEGNICSENNCFIYEIQNTDPSLDIVVSWFDCCKQIQSEISLKPGEFNEVNSSYNPIVTGGSYNIFVVSISPCN